VGFGILDGVLFLIRFTLLRSTGFAHFLDDFLTMGISNILLFPCGLWLLYIGSHSDKYVKVTRCPLAFISVSPITIVIISLVFLINDFTPVSITIKSLSEPESLVFYFSLILFCLILFIIGNMLLLCQIIKSKKAIQA
jgi:succinate dehydrogenase hydrophobic anchor subunit